MTADITFDRPEHHELLKAGAQLRSTDYEEVLNLIDHLRAEGVSQHIDLPQLIVCGDQSSGKSSVLEAISGLGFPAKDECCTRFATEVILRRKDHVNVTVSIRPGKESQGEEDDTTRTLNLTQSRSETFPELIARAGDIMGIQKSTRGFCKDVLRVEVTGPTQPNLSLVDLPGLFHAPEKAQDATGVQLVEQLVLSYMHSQRSVIMAVISANNDLELQKIASLIKDVDPKGHRTLGIITKPDRLSRGSDMELSFYQLATNARIHLRLGWHVLKNRKFEERKFTLDQRRRSEVDFLGTGIWSKLPRNHAGIDTLIPKLFCILKDHILAHLPDLIDESQRLLSETRTSIQQMGRPRKNPDEQRMYLLQIGERFKDLMGKAVNGVYLDDFFGDAMQDEGYKKRLRAVVQNQLVEFSKQMKQHGEQRKILDDAEITDHLPLEANAISRSQYVDEVRYRVHRSRGRELIGTFNPMIIGDLFYLQSKPWTRIAQEHAHRLLADSQRTLYLIMTEICDGKTADGLRKHIIEPRLDKLEEGLYGKIEELLGPQKRGHPITYNEKMTESIRQARLNHTRDFYGQKLTAFFRTEVPSGKASSQRQYIFSMDDLISALENREIEDMERFACSEAVDCMRAYYGVALTKFIDDFSVLAVEKCLLHPLTRVLESWDISMLDYEKVQQIAAEDETIASERHRLERKSKTLENALRKLYRHDQHNKVQQVRPASPATEAANSPKLELVDGESQVAADNVSVLSEPDTNPDEVPKVADYDEEPRDHEPEFAREAVSEPPQPISPGVDVVFDWRKTLKKTRKTGMAAEYSS